MNAQFGRTIAWVLAAVLLAANVAGYAFDLYAAYWWFDRVLHAATLFAMTFWLAVFIPPRLLVLACILLGETSVWAERTGGGGFILPDAWLYAGGEAGARSLLGAVTASTIGVAGTTFSVMIAALSLRLRPDGAAPPAQLRPRRGNLAAEDDPGRRAALPRHP